MDAASRGLLEDIRMGLEVGVTKVVEAVRIVVRRLLFLPTKSPSHGLAELPKLTRHHTAPLPVGFQLTTAKPWTQMPFNANS